MCLVKGLDYSKELVRREIWSLFLSGDLVIGRGSITSASVLRQLP